MNGVGELLQLIVARLTAGEFGNSEAGQRMKELVAELSGGGAAAAEQEGEGEGSDEPSRSRRRR